MEVHGGCVVIGYHVTTKKKLDRYIQSGMILPPVRFFPNEYTARRWARRTGRELILKISCETSYPLPDHKPAYWTPEWVSSWEVL